MKLHNLPPKEKVRQQKRVPKARDLKGIQRKAAMAHNRIDYFKHKKIVYPKFTNQYIQN